MNATNAKSTRHLRLGFGTLMMSLLAVGAIANWSTADIPLQSHRRSTDPPLPARGNLGQDLFLAIDQRDVSAVKALLKSGADPNSRNGLEFTPLFVAAASHQPEVMSALLGAGATPDADSAYGTPLTFAAAGGHFEGAKMLLAKGADVSTVRSDGMTVLMMAANTGVPPIVEELIKRKADVNAKDDFGSSALSLAARGGHADVARLLLAAGAETNTTDSQGQTPLMTAAQNGHADLVRLFIKHGAKVGQKDLKGRTALHLATAYGDYPEVVSALVEAGANPNAIDKSGRTSTDYAAAREGKESKPRFRTTRESVQASLNLMQASMQKFNQRTACVSCHQEGLGRIATGLAMDHGFNLDQSVQKLQRGRLSGTLKAMLPMHTAALKDPSAMKQLPLIEMNEVSAIDSWLLTGMAANKEPANAGTAAMALVLARQQSKAGYWSFSLPRTPMQSSFFTVTALAIRSLQTYGPKSNAEELAERIQRAKQWLQKSEPRTSEDRASRLLGLKWANAPLEDRSKAADAILADQRPDGGWSQLPSLASDAYATGQALYALREGTGFPVNNLAYQRGVNYLLRTQDDDGSWFVNKRAIPANNYLDAGFPHGQSQYSSFNGTAWATMALLETLPKKSR